MPCSSDGYPDVRDRDLKKMKARLDETTRLLCAVLRGMPTNIKFVLLADVHGLEGWEEEHAKIDKARIDALCSKRDNLKAELKSVDDKIFKIKRGE